MARQLNLPNALTSFRILLVPVLVVVILTRPEQKEGISVAIFLLAAATDWLDGWLARRRSETTTLGALLDPLADKLLIAGALISLVEVGVAPAWMVVIIIGREFAVTGLRGIAAEQGITIAAREWGKVKMVGFDTGTQSVNDLRAGDIQALVVQNPLRMGYDGVHHLVRHLQGGEVPRRIDTGVTLVTKDNMDHPEVKELIEPPLDRYLK